MPRRIHHEEHEGHEERNTVSCRMQQLLVQCHLGRCAKQASPLRPTGLGIGSSVSSCDSFVSFVVRHFYASVRSLAFDSFSGVTHSSLPCWHRQAR